MLLSVGICCYQLLSVVIFCYQLVFVVISWYLLLFVVIRCYLLLSVVIYCYLDNNKYPLTIAAAVERQLNIRLGDLEKEGLAPA